LSWGQDAPLSTQNGRKRSSFRILHEQQVKDYLKRSKKDSGKIIISVPSSQHCGDAVYLHPRRKRFALAHCEPLLTQYKQTYKTYQTSIKTFGDLTKYPKI
jgi:hypothetical protein